MNSLAFSYFIDTSSIMVRYTIILVFKFISKATPVDRYHCKCLLAQRICKMGNIDYKAKKKTYNTLSALQLVKKAI